MIGYLQLNLQRSKTTDQLLSQIALEKGGNIFLLSEQYANKQYHLGLLLVPSTGLRSNVENNCVIAPLGLGDKLLTQKMEGR